MAETNYITKEGLQKLKDKLDYLEKVERPSISQQISEARDKGDLSENAEYSAAKEAQGLSELRISKLKDTIANSKVIDESKIDTSTVRILSTVKLKNKKNNSEMQYTIVSDSEADFKLGKISVNTPIAKGLLGKKKGDHVEIEIPSGKLEVEILDIRV